MQKRRCLTFKGEINVGIVVGDDHLVTLPKMHDLIQQLLITDTGCGVVGVTENEQLEAIPHARAQLL